MIEIKLVAKEGKIYTDYHDKEICLNDISLIIAEMERIKLELLSKEIESDMRIDYEDDTGEEE